MLEDSILQASKTDKLRLDCIECDDYEMYSVNTLRNALQGWSDKSLDYYRVCKACRRGTRKFECSECGKSLRRSESNVSAYIYCSRSCAAKSNNRKYVKRPSEKQCAEQDCVGKIDNRSRWCKEHRQSSNIYETLYQFMTMGEFKNRHKTDAAAYNLLRHHARRIYASSNRRKACSVCDYSKNYHICHVKGLANHADDELVKDANDISNLCALCPNHHWEWDNGQLDGITW